MPNTLQNFIDNLDETNRREVNRLKAQFLAEVTAYRHRHSALDLNLVHPLHHRDVAGHHS